MMNQKPGPSPQTYPNLNKRIRERPLWTMRSTGTKWDHYLDKKKLTADLLEEQQGRCAICDDLLASPVLDHNHITDEIRGVLCPSCNMGLGCFRSDEGPINLIHAIRYLTGLEISIPDPT